jgi:hypothetical protein
MPDAVEQIASLRGNSQTINIICDTALLAAYRAGQSISPEMIQKISYDLRLTKST